MGRDDGFRLMDVSTSIANDPKFRRLQRSRPDLVAAAFTAYMALMGESWHAGRRVSLDDAWPAILPFDADVGPALIDAGLIDRRGMIAAKAWAGYFGPARDRQAASLARWARANAKRANRGGTASSPRADNAATATLPRGHNAVTRPPVLSRPDLTRLERGGGPAREGDVDDEPERPILATLAAWGATVPPNGNGIHRKVVDLVRRRGVGPTLVALEEGHRKDESASGRQLVFGAEDALDRAERPDRRDVEATERADREARAAERRAIATLSAIHKTTGHAEPHARCPDCIEAGIVGVITPGKSSGSSIAAKAAPT